MTQKKISKQSGSRVYRLRVDLLGSDPPIWRAIEIKEGTLENLHYAIQAGMGWTNSHLHTFEINGKYYEVPFDLGFQEEGTLDAAEVNLSEIMARKGKKFRYIYDLGDSWEHSIRVEEITQAEPKIKYPRCTAGAGNCPPEDCGGVWRFYDMLEALEDPEHPEHEHYSEWISEYDPDEFDPVKTTAMMQNYT